MASRRKMGDVYRRMHSFLSACNVDGVKVDVQATVTMLGQDRGGSAVASREMIQVRGS